ncbi:hypothetical protein HMPREF3165_04115 [Actinomyces sp. HMSC08A09]|uniref:hypothetical protein n=1 Tax=Actinomyces sp. HMSC08A09 TaxID=1581133 RepID=UPI0008A53AE8|nr:hypothetical protein [Actinomyces sp. HMSC08A09]OFT41480.1 hypothetical protein HMPREF3165_04115 [Actinomyces sp. HMSC08A09]
MSDAWLAFLVVFAMLVAIWRIADGRERPMTKSEQERMFFRQTYSLSIDRMLSESPLDRDEVRRLRDSGRRDGSARAIRYAQEWDPVPRDIAAQFVDRV